MKSQLIFLLTLCSSTTAYWGFPATAQCLPDGGCESPFERCKEVPEDSMVTYPDAKMCFQKDLFPMMPIEIIGAIIVPIVSMISAPTGVGTGSILTPFFIYFFGFTALETVPIKIPILSILALNRIIMNRNYRYDSHLIDPDTKQPAKVLGLDYGLVIVIFPMMLMGSTLGVLINRTLAEWFAMIILALFIAQAARSTWQRYFREKAKERKKALEKAKEVEEELLPEKIHSGVDVETF